MGSHPINLFVRFLLEITALVSIGIWGWEQFDRGILRYLLAIGLPLALAIVWATFTVPNDPSRSGSARVITSGIVRLIIECAVFAFGVWALYKTGGQDLSIALAVVTLVHYIVSYDRVRWLLNQ